MKEIWSLKFTQLKCKLNYFIKIRWTFFKLGVKVLFCKIDVPILYIKKEFGITDLCLAHVKNAKEYINENKKNVFREIGEFIYENKLYYLTKYKEGKATFYQIEVPIFKSKNGGK